MTTIDLLRDAAEVLWPGVGAWVHDEWQKHNQQYWDGRLECGGIVFGLTPHGRSLGCYESIPNRITLHTSLLVPSGNAWHIANKLGKRYALDTLLHEMIHQAQYQLYDSKPPKNRGHVCESWAIEVNRISKSLGIEPRASVWKSTRTPKGPRLAAVDDNAWSRADQAYWPQAFRPAGYYGGDTLPTM